MRRQVSAPFSTLACLALLTGCGGGGSDGTSQAPPSPPPPPPPPAVNQAPTASFTAPSTLIAGDSASLDAAGSSDPENGVLLYYWAFGDGGHGGTPRIGHLFSDAGVFTVRLRVTDPQGLSHETTRTITVTEPAAAATVTARGVVTTLAGAPLADVTVRAEGSTATAQSNALGELSLSVAKGQRVTLNFSKPGYADQIQLIELPASAGNDAYFEVSLLPRAAAQTLADAAAGGTLTGEDGAKLTLPANALVNVAGAAVTGAVQVSMTPVNINSDELPGFPGRFVGVNPDASHTPIVSYGTTEFVITQGGEKLQLRPGVRAAIELPLYAAGNLDGSALAAGGQLPLWSLDERSGLWINEGEGTLAASTSAPAELVMRAEVSHFSFWNADKGVPSYRPRPKCINDVPGQYDSIFEQATICKMLAEMDKPIPAQGVVRAPAKATANNSGALAVEPQYRFPSMRVTREMPIAGGVSLDVPPDFDVVLTGTALNGTWRGQVRTRGALGATPEVIVPLRPVNPGTPNQNITLPFDEIRAATAGNIDRYRFTATAGQGISIAVSQASSTLTGWLRLRNSANEILIDAPFDSDAAAIEFRIPQDGEYTLEVAPLTNAPGGYRLVAATQSAVERVASITLTEATEIGAAKVATNAAGITWAAWPEFGGADTLLKASRFVNNTAGWSLPETVATITGFTAAVAVQIGVDDAGNVFTLWDMGAGPVFSRRVASSGSWSTALPLASATCGGGQFQRLSVTPGGSAMVAWVRPAAAGVCARRYSGVEESWAPEHVSDSAQAHPSLSVDFAANGEAAIAWSHGGNGFPIAVQLARFRNSAWEAPIPMGGANAASPGVLLTANGRLLLYWQNVSRTVEATWQAGDSITWLTPQTLGTNSGAFYLPRHARRADDRLQIIWWAEGTGLVSRELDTVAQTWGTALPIAPARAASAANVAVAGGNGGSVVMWWASKLSGSGSDFGLSTGTASAWSTPSAVLATRPVIFNQAATFRDSGSVVVDSNGIATILWREYLPPGQSGVLLRASRIPLVP